jgi:hypothetical protein
MSPVCVVEWLVRKTPDLWDETWGNVKPAGCIYTEKTQRGQPAEVVRSKLTASIS